MGSKSLILLAVTFMVATVAVVEAKTEFPVVPIGPLGSLAVVESTGDFVPRRADSSANNTLVVGTRTYGDFLALSQPVKKSASIIGKKVIHEETFSAPYGYVITQAAAVDQATNGHGASVTVTGGGPNQDHIKFRFKSERFHGIDYVVQLYARRR